MRGQQAIKMIASDIYLFSHKSNVTQILLKYMVYSSLYIFHLIQALCMANY